MSDTADRAARSRSFETVAEDYERYRPDYPREAIEWAAAKLGLAEGARVLDVGAGTGKLTRGLVAAGFSVAAAEPGGAMLDELRVAVPEAEALEAPAEQIPLPDESCDAAFAAQCFHWFDRERALLGPIVGYAGLVPYRAPELPGPPWFTEIGRTVTESVDESSPEQLVGMLATTSTFLTADPAEGEEWLASIWQHAEGNGSRFPFPKLTYAFAYRRIDYHSEGLAKFGLDAKTSGVR